MHPSRLTSPLSPPPTAPASAQPKPTKALFNLTTPVETLAFNHDGQLLFMASRFNKNAVRMVKMGAGGVGATGWRGRRGWSR